MKEEEEEEGLFYIQQLKELLRQPIDYKSRWALQQQRKQCNNNSHNSLERNNNKKRREEKELLPYNNHRDKQQTGEQ